MALTDILRRQHHAATLLATRLRDLVDHYRNSGDAYRVTLQLARLHSLLRLHFAQEDGILYPVLMASGDPRTVSVAHSIQDESGPLAEQIEGFMQRWSSSALIGSDFAAFRTELDQMLDRLDLRIAREENELYPLAEGLGIVGRKAA